MLILQHHDDTDTCLMSKKSALIVNSIKIIGKNNISKEKIKTLHNFLNANERKKLIKESKHLPNWIKIIIEEICK